MRIGFVGAGKVGRSFAMYLSYKGFEVSGFYSRTVKEGITCFDSLEVLMENSDIIGITVNDDEITKVVSEITSLKYETKDKMFFHMSGVHNSALMSHLSEFVFSLHPLKAFPQMINASERFEEIYFSLENPNAKVLEWVNQLGIRYFVIPSESKAKYHAAAAIVSNYLVSVIHFGLSQLTQIGIDYDVAQKAFWPLIVDTITNIESYGTVKALTGPIVRGDVETVKRHLEVIHETDQYLYKALGVYTLGLTEQSTEISSKLMDLLKEETSCQK